MGKRGNRMMSNKKKQTAVVAVATVLSVSTMVNPIVINAQDVVHEESSQSYKRKEAPEIIPPQDLKAKAGTPLKEIKLPDNWTWEDEIAILSENRKDYAARFAVDDESYDYTNVKGYHAEDHYVEVLLPITIETEHKEQELSDIETAKPDVLIESVAQSIQINEIPTTYADTGDVAIDETNFPDDVFRAYIVQQFDDNKDNVLSATEIEGIKNVAITVENDLKSLTGIELFPNLEFLEVRVTGLERLDVSQNKKLKKLSCGNNSSLTSINVNRADALETLNCSNTGITALDVSQNPALTTLDCSYTSISVLDVSNHTALTSLNCMYSESLTALNIEGTSSLETLRCNKTAITILDVSQHTQIKALDCGYNEALQTLNIENADALETLDCPKTSIEALDIRAKASLTALNCSGTKIKALDVSQNKKLKELKCGSNLSLTTLNVNGADDLETLECLQTSIKELDVTGNALLTSLNCLSTKIETLDVSQNTALTSLATQSANLTVLDLSNNKQLTTLSCYSNPLAYLNLPTDTALTTVSIPTGNSSMTINVSNDTFDMNEVFPGIDSTKVTITSGATAYDKDTGIVGGYVNGTPIQYTYDCGKDKNGNTQTLGVKLYLVGLKEPSSISLISTSVSLSKAYDGTTVTPSISKTGSSGAVTYTWKKKLNDATWEDLTTAPIAVGTYQVTAHLAADNNYQAADSSPVEFTISKGDSTIAITSKLDKTYDKEAVSANLTLTQTGSTGTVSYTWEKKISDTSWQTMNTLPKNAGTYRVTATVAADNNYEKASSTAKEFTISKADSTISVTESLNKDYDGSAVNDTPTVSKTGSTGAVTYAWEKKNNRGNWESITAAPMNAGIYRVTATVAADDNYKSATATKEFTISQAEPSYIAPMDLQAIYGQSLKDITLPTGFAWTDQTLDVGNAGINEFTLTYTPENDNYKIMTDIKVTVTVTKAKNGQVTPISLEGWTYGAAPSAVRAGFRFGQPRFLYSDRMAGTYTDTVPTAAGTWYVKAVVDGTDNYEGAESEVVSFVIEPKSVETGNQIKVPEMSTDTRLDDLVIKDGDKVLVQGTDYDVTQIQDGNKVVVTITFKGNYTGTVVQAYTNEEKDKDMQMDSSDTQKESGKKKSDKKDTLNNANPETVPTGDTTAKGIWTMFMLFVAGVGAFMRKRFVKK